MPLGTDIPGTQGSGERQVLRNTVLGSCDQCHEGRERAEIENTWTYAGWLHIRQGTRGSVLQGFVFETETYKKRSCQQLAESMGTICAKAS